MTHGDAQNNPAIASNLVVKSRKAVVVVGAVRPSTAISADGLINHHSPVSSAGSGEAVGKGALVVLND